MYQQGEIDTPGVDIGTIDYGDIPLGELCAHCFNDVPGCLSFGMNIYEPGDMVIIYADQGPNPATDYCPYGIDPVLDAQPGSVYGAGSCGPVS
jgi:hypothetical protein